MIGKTKVLVVDDEAAYTRLLKLNLERSGRYEVEIVNQSRRTIPAAHEFRPDVILLDIVMPGIDGGDVQAKLAEDVLLRGTPVIFVTALVSDHEVSENGIVNSGGRIMLPKPVNLDKLEATIGQVIKGALA